MKAGTLDLIICNRVNDPKIEFTTLFDEQLILLVPRDHRLAKQRTVSVRDLAGENFIAHNRTTALHDILADLFMRNHTHVNIVGEFHGKAYMIC